MPNDRIIPTVVVSSRWDESSSLALQSPHVTNLLLFRNIKEEESGKSYASALLEQILFPKTKYNYVEKEDALITILHCSDFHYKKDSSIELEKRFRLTIEALSEEIEFDKGEHLDFICMGGDFIDKGNVSNYQQCINIFDNFINKISDKTKHKPIVLTVPGNHDYNREHAMLLLKYPELLDTVFFPYWNFTRTLSVEMDELQKKPSDMWIYKDTAPFGFYFYGLNTEIQKIPSESSEEKNKKDKLFEGIITQSDIETLRTTHEKIIEQYGDRDILPIGLMHRTLSPATSIQNDPSSTKYILNFDEVKKVTTRDNCSPLFLCGDLHLATTDTFIGGNNSGVLSSAPPFMGEYENGFQGFNLIFLKKEKGTIKEIDILPFSFDIKANIAESRPRRRAKAERINGNFCKLPS